MDTIDRFQNNLQLIRKASGLSAEELGRRVGVSRQTINNLESNRGGKFKLTRPMYIALRSILDEDIKRHENETKMLQAVLKVFVDSAEKYTNEQRESLKKSVEMFAPSMLTKSLTRTDVVSQWMTLFLPILGIGLLTTDILTDWLEKLLDEK